VGDRCHGNDCHVLLLIDPKQCLVYTSLTVPKHTAMGDQSNPYCFVPGDSQNVPIELGPSFGPLRLYTGYPEPVIATTATASRAAQTLFNSGLANRRQQGPVGKFPTVDDVIWTPNGFQITSLPQPQPSSVAVSETRPQGQCGEFAEFTRSNPADLGVPCQPLHHEQLQHEEVSSRIAGLELSC